MSLDFSGCRAKIGRAYEHHEALQSFLQDTFAVESNRVGVRIQFDMKASEYIVYIDRVPVLDTALRQVALIAGDVIQNLRACLDHILWQLAMNYTKGAVALDRDRERNVQFPIIDNPCAWGGVKGRNLADIPG
jgi:hypothetical protein